MENSNRLTSIDIMRGLTLLLMLFVNDLNMKVAPAWMGHMAADFDGMGLADWVFPGFLFIVGMSVPFALSKRISSGDSPKKISLHILTRTVSLLFIGVLMLNTGRVNPELTGMSKDLWALLMYISVFMLWNTYPVSAGKMIPGALKITGALLLGFLLIHFRSGTADDPGWLRTGWWGILGLIGWGYLPAAFCFLFFRDSITKTALAALFFFTLNILSGLGLLHFLDPVSPVLGILIQGNNPFIVMSGLLAAVVFRNYREAGTGKLIAIFVIAGLAALAAGFILRNWFIISKIKATPSWAMICNGISLIVFILVWYIADIRKWRGWAVPVMPAGRQSLTTYLAPDILYHAIWLSGLPILIYKTSSDPLVVVAGSVLWAFLMAGLTALLARINIRLKL